MSQPDIIVPVTQDPTGPKAWCWVDCISIDRNGGKSLSGVPQLEDKWRVSLVVRASLAKPDGTDVYKDGDKEVTVPSPLPSLTCDVADILHDPQVQQLMGLMRDVSLRLASGDLKPTVTEG